MSNIKTVTVSAETAVKFDAFYPYVWIKNTGDTIAYASAFAGIVAGAENVTAIPAGESVMITAETDTVYLLSTGTTAEVHGQGYAESPFLDNYSEGSGTPTLQPITITENGVYTVPSGYDGYGTITVEVETMNREVTTLWTNAGSDATITLSDDYDNYDELVFYGSYTYNNADYKTFGVVYTDGVSVGDHIQPLSNNSGGTEYTVSSKTELTDKAAIGFMWQYDKVVGVKYTVSE